MILTSTRDYKLNTPQNIGNMIHCNNKIILIINMIIRTSNTPLLNNNRKFRSWLLNLSLPNHLVFNKKIFKILKVWPMFRTLRTVHRVIGILNHAHMIPTGKRSLSTNTIIRSIIYLLLQGTTKNLIYTRAISWKWAQRKCGWIQTSTSLELLNRNNNRNPHPTHIKLHQLTIGDP